MNYAAIHPSTKVDIAAAGFLAEVLKKYEPAVTFIQLGGIGTSVLSFEHRTPALSEQCSKPG